MPEWLAIALAGGLGGCIGTFLPAGTDVPSPSIITERLQGHRNWELAYHVVRNTVLGGLASFVLWATYETNASFLAEMASPKQVGMSLVIGAGGSWIIDRLVRKTQQAAVAEENTDRLAEAFREYIEVSEAEDQDEQEQLEAEREADQDDPL